MTLSERLVQLIDVLAGGNRKAFAERIGVPTNTYKSWIQRGIMEADKILTACPEVSVDWLVLDKGPMFYADIEADRDLALATLGITEEQLATLKQPTVNHSEGETRAYADNNNEQPSSDAPLYTVREGEAVDRAMLNYLLRELASRDQRIAILEQRNLALERDNAVMSDRLQNAETWYRQNIQNKKG